MFVLPLEVLACGLKSVVHARVELCMRIDFSSD